MKALTLHQPWATLLALGIKRFETRSWETGYRGPLAIHAGKAESPEAKRLMEDVLQLQGAAGMDVRRVLHAAGIQGWGDLPLGAVVGVGRLEQCWMTDSLLPGASFHQNFRTIVNLERQSDSFSAKTWAALEVHLGDFTPGRFAWQLSDVRPIDPVPARGYQNLWNWDEAAA